MNVLALEPWYGGSHRNFLDGLIAHSRHQIHPISMSARFWKWRMHGGAVTMARKVVDWVKDGNHPDVIFATDMVNVPAFLALTRPYLADTPIVFYLHENQLTYPLKAGRERDYTYAYINYLSCLSADHIVFNSQFHHDEFLDALPVLLRAFPDYNHLHSVHEIKEKSTVMHLGMDLRAHDQYAQQGEEAGLRPQCLVRQCGIDSGPGDWPGDGAIRVQHLQVLHCLPLHPGAAGRPRRGPQAGWHDPLPIIHQLIGVRWPGSPAAPPYRPYATVTNRSRNRC